MPPLLKRSSLNINDYVIGKAPAGLFYILGQQEKEIRTDPLARTTPLLKEVSGKNLMKPEQGQVYLEPTQEAGYAFITRQLQGNIIMLNLLRFREVADYSATPELAPANPISGAQAFELYIEHTLPYLRESGGYLIFLGAGGRLLIGPPSERWDMAMLVQQSSVASFLAFASHQPYLAGMGHRTAALEDSRLLPLSEIALTGDPALNGR